MHTYKINSFHSKNDVTTDRNINAGYIQTFIAANFNYLFYQLFLTYLK